MEHAHELFDTSLLHNPHQSAHVAGNFPLRFFIHNVCLIYTMSHPLNCENCLCSMLLVVFDVIINTESNTAYIVQVYSAMR